MKRILFSLFTMIVTIAAIANDGVYFTSGNQLIPLQETDISVKKEILTISLMDDQLANVDVYYEFYNSSNTEKTVLMGFEADPSYNDDYELHPSGVHPNIKNFNVEINSEKISYKNAISNLDIEGFFNPLDDASKWEEGCEKSTDTPGHENCGSPIALYKKGNHSKQIENYAYVYYFNATFKPGINKVHHTYKYQMSGDVMTAFTVPYKLSPAARWANRQIDDFTLIIRADNTAKYFTVDTEFPGAEFTLKEGCGKINGNIISLRNGAVSLHMKNFRPEPEHELFICSADRLHGETQAFGSFYDRSSVLWLYMWWEYNKDTDNDDIKLTQEQFKRIAKNLPYANRGHVFKDPVLNEYFSNLWWYMPDPSYKDDTKGFTKQDWTYINWKP